MEEDQLAYSIYPDGLRRIILGPTKCMRALEEILIPEKKSHFILSLAFFDGLNDSEIQRQQSLYDLPSSEMNRRIQAFNAETLSTALSGDQFVNSFSINNKREKSLSMEKIELREGTKMTRNSIITNPASLLCFGNMKNNNVPIGAKPALPWSYYSQQAKSNMLKSPSSQLATETHQKQVHQRPPVPLFQSTVPRFDDGAEQAPQTPTSYRKGELFPYSALSR